VTARGLRQMAGGGPSDGRGTPAGVPAWLTELATAAQRLEVPEIMQPPPGGGRRSAILILFGSGTRGPDVLLVQRSPALRRHPGQVAFPGGAIDETDDGPVGAALREAAEEAGVEPSGVQVVTTLPDLYIWRSGYQVSPVIAWWQEPVPVRPGDPAEVVAVARVAMADLAEPANRWTVEYPVAAAVPGLRPDRPDPNLRVGGGSDSDGPAGPGSGGSDAPGLRPAGPGSAGTDPALRPAGPGFLIGPMLIWGFTAYLLDRLLALGGWELPWDASRTVAAPVPLPDTGRA
jgi:8-oxo-dGTP pyrophosphatase MutT (NUDIX family)